MQSENWHVYKVEDILKKLNSNTSLGLTQHDALNRLNKFGENKLAESKRTSAFLLLLHQFKDFMVIVLLAATLLSGLLGEYIDAIAIIAIVIINGILGFFQEYRAEKSLQALKELTAPSAHVIRDGIYKNISAVELVPGDIVRLQSGDRVPADVRLFMCKGLFVEESALTGESVPVAKQEQMLERDEMPLGDQKNMAFMGTLVVQGAGLGIVVGTGMNTEMGHIAHLLDSTKTTATPLAKRLDHLGKILIVIALALTLLVVITGIWHGQQAYSMLLAGVSLAVAAIPEGLPAIVTIALALGVQRMIRRRAIVRKLPSVETLGCTTVICTDKTGTLTENKMMVTQFFANGDEWQVDGIGYIPEGTFKRKNTIVDVTSNKWVKSLLEMSVLSSNTTLQRSTVGRHVEWIVNGDPTEGALVVLAGKVGVWKEDLMKKWKHLHELPFDSNRKMMSVAMRSHNGAQLVAVKGAPEVIFEKCTSIVWQDRVQPLTMELKEQLLATSDRYASDALRIIAVAYKDINNDLELSEEIMENNLTLMGILGMIDPPREEVPQAIVSCKDAGVKVIMITGDHKLTAERIATDIGILPVGGKVLTGTELGKMTEDEYEAIIDDVYVYARVSPEHKLQIVKSLQHRGEIVAMTGDGVNDAPAIKAANIGIAMGITGTDVAKEASSLVLADDNFATIKDAIEEGRSIYDNIRKFIRYLLASNVGEILVMLFAMLLALPLPLIPLQILWVNLVTDGLPALALGLDQPEKNSMKQPPRNSKESLFARGLGWKIVSRGILIGVVTLFVFIITLYTDATLETAQTMAFATLVVSQLIHVFDCRSEKSIFHRNPLQNKYLLLAVLSSFILLLGVIYWGPAQVVFRTVDLSVVQWVLIIVFGAIPSFLASSLRFISDKRVKTKLKLS